MFVFSPAAVGARRSAAARGAAQRGPRLHGDAAPVVHQARHRAAAHAQVAQQRGRAARRGAGALELRQPLGSSPGLADGMRWQ